MKKVNLLSKAEMKKVMGGNVLPGDDDSEPGTCSCSNGTSVKCKNCSVSEGYIWCDGKKEKSC